MSDEPTRRAPRTLRIPRLNEDVIGVILSFVSIGGSRIFIKDGLERLARFTRSGGGRRRGQPIDFSDLHRCAQISQDFWRQAKRRRALVIAAMRRRSDGDIHAVTREWFRDKEMVTEEYGHISNWDVSGVTNMSHLFQFDRSRTFNEDLSSWDTSNVTNMGEMFLVNESFNSNISSWNTSKVTSMWCTFKQAKSFNCDLSSWDVSNVVDSRGMFGEATAFNGDISSWDVSKVRIAKGMFKGAAAFSGDLSLWNVSNIRNMDSMFLNATAFDRDTIKDWDLRGNDLDDLFK
ncbi:hypothetical protein TrST_g332 [Triparma strigata]|uniref:BspA family leucine-rich repeat surface protein n=1 Tax=Triparma strigata TaxID=1606541 RepID=A0A9W7ARW8_9STRA|nr:hypothetical protein TrST_g332 [Triparma strigata]